MNALKIVSRLYECTGNRGIRFCDSDYPSGWLPESEFTENSLDSGTCRTCRKAMNDVRKHLYAYAGLTSDAYYMLPDNAKAGIYNLIWASMYGDGYAPITKSKPHVSKAMLLAASIAGVRTVAELYGMEDSYRDAAIETATSMLEEGKSEVSAKQSKDPRGFCYVITNSAWPGYVKFGKALDPNSRLSSYNTNSPLRDYKLEEFRYFENRAKSEREILNSTEQFRSDAVGEWRKMSVSDAVDVLINTWEESNGKS